MLVHPGEITTTTTAQLHEIKESLTRNYQDSAIFHQKGVGNEPALYSACQKDKNNLSIGKVTFFDHYGNSFTADNCIEISTDHYDEVQRILVHKIDGQTASIKDRLTNTFGCTSQQRRLARLAMASVYIESVFKLLDHGHVIE